MTLDDSARISSQDRKLQRTVEQTLDDPAREPISQIMEESFEVDKSAFAEGISERICKERDYQRDQEIKPRPQFVAYSGADARWFC